MKYLILGLTALNSFLIYLITKQNKKIMGNQKEAADKLTAIGAQLGKANTEIQAKIQELKDASANADISPELQAAIDGVTQAGQVLDDIVPDVVDPGTGDTGGGDTGGGDTGEGGTPAPTFKK